MTRRAARVRPCGIVTLLTDFGTRDSYVAEMKGAILSRAAHLRLVDVTHEIPAHDVRSGAFQLGCAASAFPTGTVHLAVVDPGVGGAREAIAVRTRRAYFVGPDNGLLSSAARAEGIAEVRAISRATLGVRALSRTFHGRDLFAPAAAWIASGRSFRALGPIARPPLGSLAAPTRSRSALSVLAVDRFGNLILSAPAGAIPRPRALSLRVRGRVFQAPWVDAYEEVPRGRLLAIEGSHGFLELAVREGSAARRLSIAAGDRMRLSPAVRG